jgi:PAS domain S-box-containing protein
MSPLPSGLRQLRYEETDLRTDDQDSSILINQAAEIGRRMPDVLVHLIEGIAALTAEHVVVAWNPQAETLTGYTLADITAIGLMQVFEPIESMQQLVRQTQAGASTTSECLRLRRADGQQVPVSVQCLPLHSLGEHTAGVIVRFRELSALETLQNCLWHSERLRLLGCLAGSLSHEICNPLNALFLHTDILEEEVALLSSRNRDQLLHSLTLIREAGARLDTLVQDYLSLARLTDIPREPEDLGEFLEAFGWDLQEQLATHNIALRLEGLADLGQVALHAPTFRRALRHVLQYVIDALTPGESLTLCGWRGNSQLHFDIRTTGSDIPEEELALLFNPLETTKAEAGGLGLYLVREIMRAHQGKITVSSAPGMGTTFTVSLPVLAEREEGSG